MVILLFRRRWAGRLVSFGGTVLETAGNKFAFAELAHRVGVQGFWVDADVLGHCLSPVVVPGRAPVERFAAVSSVASEWTSSVCPSW